jgi:hypothetical protein
LSRRSRIVGFGSAGLLVLAGVACAVIFSGTLGQNLAFALVAVGLVLATSLVFYEVGLTEDRERARERRQAGRARLEAERQKREAERAKSEATPGQPGAERTHPEPHPPERRRRNGLDRLRGRPRRLR